MCGGTDSAATVKGNTTKEQDDAQRKRNKESAETPDNYRTPEEAQAAAKALKDAEARGLETAAQNQARANDMQGFGIKPPPDSPDMADELLRKRRAAEATSLMLGRGRKSTMQSSTFGEMAIGKGYKGGGS